MCINPWCRGQIHSPFAFENYWAQRSSIVFKKHIYIHSASIDYRIYSIINGASDNVVIDICELCVRCQCLLSYNRYSKQLLNSQIDDFFENLKFYPN
jgi:hypothetical protein